MIGYEALERILRVLDNCTVVLRNFGLPGEESFSRRRSESHNEFGLDPRDLIVQILAASLHLLDARLVVTRRTAADRIGNEYLGVSDPMLPKLRSKLLPRFPDEGSPFTVFIRTRGLSDYHDPSVLRSFPCEAHRSRSPVEFTVLTVRIKARHYPRRVDGDRIGRIRIEEPQSLLPLVTLRGWYPDTPRSR